MQRERQVNVTGRERENIWGAKQAVGREVKARVVRWVLVGLAAMGWVSGQAALGPRIEFAEPVADLGELMAGQVVKHDFVYTNVGDSTLEIRAVRASCGCTTAGEWERRVEPGGTGRIPIQFNSANFNGPVAKTVMVQSNDPEQGTVVLQVKGKIYVAVEVLPKTLAFQYQSDDPVSETKTVRLINNLDEPLDVKVRCEHAAFELELETVRPGKEFAVHVRTVPPLGPGNVVVPIVVETGRKDLPAIQVQAYAIERQAVVISPRQLILPAGRLTAETRPSVTIRSQAKQALELSEPAIDVPGAEVELREMQAGRVYSLTAIFPEGFELPAGRQVRLSVKSNHQRYPVIEVPVQGSRPVPRSVTSAGVRSLPGLTNAVVRPGAVRTNAVVRPQAEQPPLIPSPLEPPPRAP
jgi:hypothetical protein